MNVGPYLNTGRRTDFQVLQKNCPRKDEEDSFLVKSANEFVSCQSMKIKSKEYD